MLISAFLMNTTSMTQQKNVIDVLNAVKVMMRTLSHSALLLEKV